jgi:Flp pilus assembly protein TadD
MQRGIKAYREKNYLEAADNFDRATKAEPGNGQAWQYLALTCAQQTSWLPQATAAIEQACALEPMNPTYLKQAGRIFALAGQADRAIVYYRKAKQWGEDDPAVQLALDELTKTPPKRGGLFGKA